MNFDETCEQYEIQLKTVSRWLQALNDALTDQTNEQLRKKLDNVCQLGLTLILQMVDEPDLESSSITKAIRLLEDFDALVASVSERPDLSAILRDRLGIYRKHTAQRIVRLRIHSENSQLRDEWMRQEIGRIIA